ncbi:MAG: hypothetical protein AAF368_12125, partial [Planctomycetota bacterium]
MDRRSAALLNTVRESAAETEAQLDGLAQVFASFGDDTEKVNAAVARLRSQGLTALDIGVAQSRALNLRSGPTPAAPTPPPGTPRTPRPTDDSTSSTSTETDDAEQKAKAQREAFEALNELLARITAERQDEELERALANLEVEYSRKSDRAKELAEEALDGAALAAAEREQVEAGLATALTDLIETQEREAQKLRDDAAKKRADATSKELAQRLGLVRGVEEAERELAGETALARVAAIEDPYERELALIEETARQERLAIEQTYQFELAAIAATTDSVRDKELQRQALRVQLEADLAKVEAERVEQTGDAEQEADEARAQRLDEYVRQVQRATDVVVDELFASFGGSDELARAEIELQRAAYLEEERALDDSLERRQISAADHAARLKEIELDRAQFERSVQEDNAGFFRRSYEGLRDVALAAIRDQLSEFVAAKAIELFTHSSTEAAKTAATEGGTVARIASLVAEKAQ